MLFLLLSSYLHSQSFCRPISNTHNVNGTVCVGQVVDSPEKAYDTDESSFATLTNIAGVGCYSEMILTLGQTGKAGDQIILNLGTGPSLLDLSLLANSSIQTKLNGTDVGSRIALNNPILNLNLLSGNEIGVVKYVLTEDANQIQIRVGGVLNVLSSLRIYDVKFESAKPTVLGGLDQFVCTGSSKTLKVINSTGFTYQWFDSVTGGTALWNSASSSGDFTTVALNADKTFYLETVSNSGNICVNTSRQAVNVKVYSNIATNLAVLTTLEGCESVNLIDAITNYDASGKTTYAFFNSANQQLTDEDVKAIKISGTYKIQAQGCSVVTKDVIVTLNSSLSILVSPSESVALGSNISLAPKATSASTISWYDPKGNPLAGPLFNTGPLTVPGVYTYSATVKEGNCTKTAYFSINVLNPDNCQTQMDRVYATMQSSGSFVTGGVVNPTLAVDGNPQTFSTIVTGLGLLGFGTSWQNLQWKEVIPKGTPVTIKLGYEYSGLAIGQGVSVVATKRDTNGTPIDIGILQGISGSLVDLLPGNNSFEYTFIPSSATVPKEYDGIRVVSGSIVGVAQNTKLFDAYYSKATDISKPVNCVAGDIEDVFSGVTRVGTGVLTSTVGVSEPWNVADNNVNTYATMFTGVGVLAAADLKVKFKSSFFVTDTLRIVVSKPATVLSVNLLTGFSIQRFLGNVAVGAPITNTSSLLSVKILSGGSMSIILVNSLAERYDSVRIRLGGVAGVLDFLYVHTVERVANTKVIDSGTNNQLEVCQGSTITLELPEESCSKYKWYDAATGGNVVGSGASFKIPATTAGLHKYYVQSVRYGCESMQRGVVTVNVINPPVPTTANTTQNFCKRKSLKFSSIAVSPSTVKWYDAVTGGKEYLLTDDLVSGTYYAAALSSGCESSERLKVVVNVTDPGTPELINKGVQFFCATGTTSFADIQFKTPIVGNIVWYDNLTGGTIIPSSSILTSGTYYATILEPLSLCESEERLKVEVIVSNTIPAPTTNKSTQDFCSIAKPTIADIQVNEAPVVWFKDATDIIELAPTELLEDKKSYFGVIKGAGIGCVGSDRLEVKINISDPGTPTTTDTTQDFCLEKKPTVADIQTNETGVTWYSVATAGTILDPTTALVNGNIYYGSIKDATSGCESSVRLAITVAISDAGTPTTTDTTQNFCLGNRPTVVNLQVNEAGVNWYSTAAGGTILDPTTVLVNGNIYYGSIKNATSGCESSVRLAITVLLNDPGTPTTDDTTQDFCLVNKPTVANLQVNETGVIWYTAAIGGTVVNPTTALISGTLYYGALNTLGCESATRLSVSATIIDPATPTLVTAGIQNFCLAEAPTFENIEFIDNNIVWYTALNGGSLIVATTALTSGTYYAALKNVTSGCESSVRLPVTINVNDPATPTLVTPGTQNVCLAAAPTFASIQFNESNIVWYTFLIGGSSIASTTALTNGTYFAALKDGTTGCESSVRLPVTINVVDSTGPISSTDDTPCVFQEITYSILNGKSNFQWVITNGIIVSGGSSTDATVTVSWPQIGLGKIDLNYTTNCDENLSKTLNVTVVSCSDLTIAKSVNNLTPNFDDEIVFTITVNNVGEGNFVDVIVNEKLESGFEFVSAVASTGAYDVANGLWTIPSLLVGKTETLEVKVKVLRRGIYTNTAAIQISNPLDTDLANNSAEVVVTPICLTVYNEFTPNNDGANDLFMIDCLENYPNNELKIFNRYGTQVYGKQNYQNDWNGTANVSGVVNRGDMLPSGTYFYVIELGDGTVKKGWLSLVR